MSETFRRDPSDPSTGGPGGPPPTAPADEGTGAEVQRRLVSGVLHLTIDRPERRNAMNWDVIRYLRAEVEAARHDAAIAVVVLAGAGDEAFCSGADLGAMREGHGQDGSGFLETHEARGELAGLFRALWDLGKPTVARVQGWAMAGGFGLALACDLVVASERARFGAPEAGVGLWPYMITVPMVRSMLPKQALELMLTGRVVGAAEAERRGFVTTVVPHEELRRRRGRPDRHPGVALAGRDEARSGLVLRCLGPGRRSCTRPSPRHAHAHQPDRGRRRGDRRLSGQAPAPLARTLTSRRSTDRVRARNHHRPPSTTDTDTPSGNRGPMPKRALITGITGQDGSYLAEFLLDQEYEVVGMVRRSSTLNFERIAHIQDRITLVAGDLLDEVSLIGILREHRPVEVYNLAAQSFVQTSWGQPVLTGETTALGVTRLLDAIRIVDPDIRFYQASSSEMFGKVHEVPQTETTPFYPRSPYGVAKVYGHWITVNYRESYGLHASSGMLFNHESPRRGLEFVTRKVTNGAARVACGLTDKLPLGNLDAQRDWGFAGDYVRAMWLMLQRDEPGDFVVATGETHSVRELCEIAFSRAGLDWQEHVVVDDKFLRPAEVDLLVGDPSRARDELGWERQVTFADLIAMMVDADMALVRGSLPS